jgi:hypothetical protein
MDNSELAHIVKDYGSKLSVLNPTLPNLNSIDLFIGNFTGLPDSPNPNSIGLFIGKFTELDLINKKFECFTKRIDYDWLPSKKPRLQSNKDQRMELMSVIELGGDIRVCYKDSIGAHCFNFIGLTYEKIEYVFIEEKRILFLKQTSPSSGVEYNIYLFQR